MNNKEHLHAEIFGKLDCIHCEKAKFLCNQKGIKYTYKELDKDFDFDFIKKSFPNARTFPQIVIDGIHVGGYDDLSKYLEE
ncbi:MAG: glutaredoxin [Gammaproteobacteria bacterium]|nr:glutaredoxin [Gammaproteobacteria bacterium]